MLPAADAVLDPEFGDHVCLPVRGEPERRAATGAFTRNGLRRRAQVLIITHTDSPERTRAWLAPLVPGFAAAESAGQIEIRASAGTHYTDGRLDSAQALSSLTEAGERARRQGRHGVYAMIDASWGAHDPPGQIAFEAATNELFGQRWLAAVCQYDRTLFAREAIDRVGCVHPISPDQAALRYARAHHPAALRLWGEVDLTNRHAFSTVLMPLRLEAGEVVIDASGLHFIDAGSAQLLVATATARPHGRTVLVCGEPMARLLHRIRADDVIDIRPVGDA
ncbi:MEDS domain-containing protein [Nonomuraea glycinis]|uniref:MEDS domain-containing protein n=1 Tax=Nonomuraea glycinis TaxID=2047744 RepID=UPI002E10FEDE|nr:MEDS domain-containing protein [Nonomuraea glycinis]